MSKMNKQIETIIRAAVNEVLRLTAKRDNQNLLAMVQDLTEQNAKLTQQLAASIAGSSRKRKHKGKEEEDEESSELEVASQQEKEDSLGFDLDEPSSEDEVSRHFRKLRRVRDVNIEHDLKTLAVKGDLECAEYERSFRIAWTTFFKTRFGQQVRDRVDALLKTNNKRKPQERISRMFDNLCWNPIFGEAEQCIALDDDEVYEGECHLCCTKRIITYKVLDKYPMGRWCAGKYNVLYNLVWGLFDLAKNLKDGRVSTTYTKRKADKLLDALVKPPPADDVVSMGIK